MTITLSIDRHLIDPDYDDRTTTSTRNNYSRTSTTATPHRAR